MRSRAGPGTIWRRRCSDASFTLRSPTYLNMQGSRTAIVTGASSGIGRATAIALAQKGWNVTLVARRFKELQNTALQCSLDPSRSTLIAAGDVTDEAFVKRLFEDTVKTFGRVDMVFNNAGINVPQVPIEDLPLEAFQSVLTVNLVGPFLCTREAVRAFKAQSPQGGRVINNGSLSAHVPRPQSAPYTCSKHAITGLTKVTALDGRPYGITCTQIDIGTDPSSAQASTIVAHPPHAGNAQTGIMTSHQAGAKQADGELLPDGTFQHRLLKEATIDVKHIADTIVHIAELPNDVTVLEMNIMASGAPYVGRG
ncbi:hypothetical protein BD626DRAFT_434875 [Schizophyllum amplum]|uniref:Short-chain dehydrogenase/reductase SDR n=1 Tax=Schizophyllum amplum TaxID=97359 RepID=A0A550C8N9_9AGAR|nr:hypothetical protein BD626DRAFT_434875 [Auriculariopsis ampla]